MAMKLITGHTGSAHVTGYDDGSMYAAIWGTGKYVLNRNSKFNCTVISSNQIKIGTGDLVMQGRHARIGSTAGVELEIDNGTSGYNRNDLVVARYKNTSGVESCELVVVKGTPTTGTATDPAINDSGTILDSATIMDMPLYRIPLTGITVGTPVQLFTVVTTNFNNVLKSSDLSSWAKASSKPSYTASEVGAAAASHNHAASNITSGTLSSDRLPTVPISKGGTGATDAATARTNLGVAAASHNHAASAITSGTLSSSRLPTITVEKGGTGATDAATARTNLGAAAADHSHAATAITSGTLSSSRLPTVPVSKGGTGATDAATARTNLGAAAADHTHTASDVGAAAASHNHSASNITSGTLPVSRGGTGLTSSPSMTVNLASTSAASVMAASPKPGVTGILPFANGGTGQSSGDAALKSMLAAGATVLSANQYGTTLPTAGTKGRIFFKKV